MRVSTHSPSQLIRIKLREFFFFSTANTLFNGVRECLDPRQSTETSLGPGSSFFARVNYAKVKPRSTRVSFICRGGSYFSRGDIPTAQLQLRIAIHLVRASPLFSSGCV